MASHGKVDDGSTRFHGYRTPRGVAVPLFIAVQLVALHALYVLWVLQWQPPELGDLHVTQGTVQDAERVCFTAGSSPSQTTYCHHRIVLANGAGWFTFPRNAVPSVDRIVDANDDRFTAGAPVEIWHERGKPKRVGGSLGDVWQIQGDRWIIPYTASTSLNMSLEMEGVACGGLLVLVAVAFCVQEVRHRRAGRPVRAGARWEKWAVAALSIAASFAVVGDASFLWPLLIAPIFFIICLVYPEWD